MSTHYDVLGVTRRATPAEVRQAYRRLALRWHPDKNQTRQEEATRQFRRINEAYRVLSDPAKRRQYDASGAVPRDRVHRPQATPSEALRDFIIRSVYAGMYTMPNRSSKRYRRK